MLFPRGRGHSACPVAFLSTAALVCGYAPSAPETNLSRGVCGLKRGPDLLSWRGMGKNSSLQGYC